MNMSDQKFSIGDRIVVFQNTERTTRYEFIGKRGIVVGYCSRDAIIRFDDGVELCIYEDDLVAERDYMVVQ